MNYCSRCVLPDTRPGIEIGPGGVCSACAAHAARRAEVDWDARRAEWQELVASVRALGRRWDCVIPVSGGKDSTWQAVTCLESGLHPLAVTWRTPGRTELGQRNLDNLIELGVDHVDFTVNPRVERKFMLEALERHGTTAIPMHLALFNIPLTIAARYDIPLVVWGENSAAEYIGTGPDSLGFRLTKDWIAKYGAVHGTTAEDWVSGTLTEQELAPYFGPTDEELEERGVRAVFLAWFFGWDPERSAAVASEHGFSSAGAARTGTWAYADIDDDFISIHHFLKWLKFGFTRSYDNLSIDIRDGRITREQAIDTLRALGDETPHEDIARFCEYAGIPVESFWQTVERFRNHDVWVRRDGTWMIEDFLIPGWDWGAGERAGAPAG